MTFNLRTVDLAKLNSLTKYPSIPTYHKLDPSNGMLTEPAVQFHGMIHLTEKIDGTNARIITLPGHRFVIGSREELLHADGDIIINPNLGIVEALLDTVPSLTHDQDMIRVYYVEVYGKKIGAAAKQYTGGDVAKTSFRLFDIMTMGMDEVESLMERDRSQIAQWRDDGGQPFEDEEHLYRTHRSPFFPLSLVPRIHTFSTPEYLPQTVDGMHEMLHKMLPSTMSALDDQAGGKAEGIVIRNEDRSMIAKARFEDYERTARKMAKSGGKN